MILSVVGPANDDRPPPQLKPTNEEQHQQPESPPSSSQRQRFRIRESTAVGSQAAPAYKAPSFSSTLY
ncbi:hypothetical protein ACFX1S_026842 [Malus domestica]